MKLFSISLLIDFIQKLKRNLLSALHSGLSPFEINIDEKFINLVLKSISAKLSISNLILLEQFQNDLLSMVNQEYYEERLIALYEEVQYFSPETEPHRQIGFHNSPDEE